MNENEFRNCVRDYGNERYFECRASMQGDDFEHDKCVKLSLKHRIDLVAEFDRMQERIEELENYICDKFSKDIILSIGDIVLVDTAKDIPYIDENELPAWCGLCGERMQIVRPGKYQCVNPDCEDCA